MEKRQFGQQRRNHSSSSSSSSSSSLAGSTGSRKATRSSNKLRRAGNLEHEKEEGERGIVGTCSFMCPEEERLQRQRLRDLAVFERLNANPHQSSPALAVKKFCRTMSAQSVRESDVRPLAVLEETLNYLLDLMDSRKYPFEVVHDFIFDRTRSIRQDLTMQNIVHGNVVIHMYEKMVKFHVVSHHKLRGSCSGSSKSSMHHLNLEQLPKTLVSLYNLYEVNRSSNSVYENEAEFRSLYVLLHLDCNGQPMGESLSLWFRNLPTAIVKSKEMCFARGVLRYFRMGNYRRFLCTTAAEASYLQYCIIEPYIDVVRALALACINNCGYKLHPYPLMHLSKLLMMVESEVELFCKSCGLETSADEVGNKVLPTKQATFCHPKGGSERYSFIGLEQFNRQIVVSTI